MSDLWCSCPTCHRTWSIARLPMDLRKVAKLAKAARCDCGTAARPVLARAADIPGSAP